MQSTERKRRAKTGGAGENNKRPAKILEILLTPEKAAETDGTGKNRNTELVILTYIFGAFFLSLVIYLIWLNTIRAKDLNSNVYNTRSESSSANVYRGDIVTEDGTVLAQTSLDYTGNEVRTYPFGNIFAHTVGYASNGKSGLEAAANSYLTNSHSSLLDMIRTSSDSEKIKGDTVEVTLNANLQRACWDALGSYRGAIVVMEPDSGKILAMVSKPDFDPNTISENWEAITADSSNSQLLNRASQGLYPPGSTFKILTTLAYLRQNNNDYLSYSYDCTGSVTQADVTITCYNSNVHGSETLADAFANSCNTAFASIGLNLDNSSFRQLADNFLFNKTLPTDIPSAQSTFALTRNTSYGDQMTTAIGQGDTLVTPLHMAMITSTVANGGIMMKPYMIARVTASDGTEVSETKPEIYDELMSVEEAEVLTSFMKQTVSSGTASALSWNSYSVAGKTGSAEYETGDAMGTHSWFVGFSNVDDPDIVVAVIAEDGGTGSTTAVPMAQQVFDAYYSYYTSY